MSSGTRSTLLATASRAAIGLLAAAPLGVSLNVTAPQGVLAADYTVASPLTVQFVPEQKGVEANETVFVQANITLNDGSSAIYSQLSSVTVDNSASIFAGGSGPKATGGILFKTDGVVINRAEGEIYGSFIGVGSYEELVVNNYGTISGGIGISSVLDLNIINNGTIDGVFAGVTTSGSAHIENRGVIRGGNAAIYLSGGGELILDTGSELQGAPVLDVNSNPTGLYEAGVVFGGDGADSLTLKGSGSEDAAFQDFETLAVEDGADWRLAGNVFFFETSDIEGSLKVDGLVGSDRTVIHAGGALGGQGTIITGNAATRLPASGASLGTFAAEGPGVFFESGSRLAQSISNGQAELLTVAGDPVTVENGATVELDFIGTVAEGDSFTILYSFNGIVGEFDDLTFATLRTSFVIETTDAEVIATAVLRTFAEAGESENQQAVGAALDAAEANGGAEFEELVTAVDAAGAVIGAAALDQVSGDFHASTASTGLVTARGFIEGLAGRVGAAGSGGQVTGLGQVASLTQTAAGPLPSGPGAGFAAWAALEGTFGTLEDENAGDTDYDSFGGTVGGDFAVMPNLVLGAALGFAVGSSETADRGATADSTVVRLAGYGRWFSGPISVTGALGASFGSLESERATPLGIATGETDATAFGFAVEGRYALALGGFTVSPLAGVSFTTLTQDAFEETGARAANLSVGEATADSFRASLGAVASKAIKNGGTTITPEARLLYRHEFADGFGEVSNAFLADATATSFTVIGAEPAADVVEIGAGVTAELGNGMSLFGDLGFTLGDGQTETNVAAGLRMSF